MDILSKIKLLPDEIQNKIFFYLSSQESRLIKNLDWENEFKIQKHKAIIRNKVSIENFPKNRYLYKNIFGYEFSILPGPYLHNEDNQSWNYYCNDMKKYFEYNFPISTCLIIR